MSEIHFIGGVKAKKRLEDGKNLSRNYSQGERVHGVDGISPCISAQMGGTANGSVLIMESKIGIQNVIQGKYDTEDVLGVDGISTTLRAQGGGLQVLLN